MAEESLKIRIGADVSQGIAGINKFNQAVTQIKPGANQATFALSNLSRVAQDAPFGFISIANNIDPLVQSVISLKAQTGSLKGALSALGSSLLGPGGLLLGFGLLSTALTLFGDKIFGTGVGMKKAKDEADGLQKSVDGVFKSVAREAVEVGTLVSVLKSETETRSRKLSAIKELNNIAPETFNNLKLEGTAVIGLDAAYQGYLANLKNVISVKILQAKLEQKITDLLKLQGTNLRGVDRLGSLDALQGSLKSLQDVQKRGGLVNPAEIKILENTIKSTNTGLVATQNEIDAILNQINELSKGVKLRIDTTSLKNATLNIDKVTLVPKEIDFSTLRTEIKNITDDIGTGAFEIPVPSLKLPPINRELQEQLAQQRENLKLLQAQALETANAVTGALAPAFDAFFNTLLDGSQNPFQALGQALKRLIVQLTATVLKAAALAAIFSIISGGSFAANFTKFLGGSSGLGGLLGGGGVPGIANSGFGGGSLIGSAARQLSVEVTGQVSGQNLNLVMTRFNQSIGIGR